MKLLYKTLAITALALPATAQAEIRLPDIIASDMVLQQQSNARIWGWATPGSKISAKASWSDRNFSTSTGSDGKFMIELPTGPASFEPRTINIDGDGSSITLDNVLIGEVWFCSGQSNMEMPLRGFWTQPVEGAMEAIAFSGKYPGIRVAKVPKRAAYTPQDSVDCRWMTSCPENAYDFTALGFFFARALTDLLNVPVGIIDCSYGGSKLEGWQSRQQIANYPEWDIDKEATDPSINEWERINVMYNAMLHPLIGYTVKGFLWNQGESNVGREDSYPQHQADMVADWRSKWKLGELPFYFVEIPGWDYGDPEADNAARFRECQHKAAQLIPNSAIVCTSDLVYPFEINDIHARKKKEIGERLAFMAAGKTYGIKGMPTEYPRFRSMDTDGSHATLHFDNAYEGFTPNKELEGFEAAGADRVFHKATARENPQTLDIEIDCPEAGEIEAVRYNFKNFAVGKVFNVLGLPLIPFRTDNWERK